MAEIRLIYADLDAESKLGLVAHDGGHEIALEPLITFLTEHLVE